MSRVYVGNASIQHHEFRYNYPGDGRQRMIPIRMMSQAILPDDFNPMQLESLVDQNEPYGFATIDEVKSGRVKKHATRLVYSTSPIASVVIEALYNINRGILDEQGREMRKQTAIAANAAVMQRLQDEKDKGLEADVSAIDLTIQEEEPRGGYDRPAKDIIAEGYEVAPAASSAAPKGHRGRGRPRKS